MDLTEVVEGTATPAYVVSQKGKIVAWNQGAERLLGCRAREVVGRPCASVVGGTDLFGNRFCCDSCPVLQMVSRGEAVRGFEIDLRDATAKSVRVWILIVVLPGESESGLNILHLVEPAPVWQSVPDTPWLEASQSSTPQAEEQQLTPREIQILSLLRRGKSTEEIASRLFICSKTVRNHIQNILPKLGAHSRLEAVSIARRNGLL